MLESDNTCLGILNIATQMADWPLAITANRMTSRAVYCQWKAAFWQNRSEDLTTTQSTRYTYVRYSFNNNMLTWG
jgi:hypothetical protein